MSSHCNIYSFSVFTEKPYSKILECNVPVVYIPIVRYSDSSTIKIIKFGTPQTIAIIVLRIEKFDETLH